MIRDKSISVVFYLCNEFAEFKRFWSTNLQEFYEAINLSLYWPNVQKHWYGPLD